jgi:2-isopropylmalate synthase
VGRYAFAHEAGIHQDGVLKERTTYEIMDARTVGLTSNSIVLGKHSGRHALSEALKEMGFEIDGQALNTAFKRFKEIADRKKQVTAMDLEALVTDELRSDDIGGFSLDRFEVEATSLRPAHAKVSVTLPEGGVGTGSFIGDGPIDAVFQAINTATGVAAKLSEFTIGAVTEGQDALGEVSVVLEVTGVAGAGQGVSTDIIDAAARAYVRALSVRCTLARRRRGRAARRLTGADPDPTFNLKDLGERFPQSRGTPLLRAEADGERGDCCLLCRLRLSIFGG